MELIDYLRVAKSRLWILIGVPVIAAALAAGFVLIQPQQYTATATISALSLVGPTGNTYVGSQAVGQYASAFQATATGPAVRNAVAAQTGASATGLAADTEVSQVGASSTMTLTYTSGKKSHVQPILRALTAETMSQMFSGQVALAQQQVTDQQAAVTAANAAITAWSTKNGMVDPNQLYQQELGHIESLEQLQAQNLASGHSTGAAALAGSIATSRASLSKYAPLIAAFDNLTSTRDAAAQSLTNAENNLAQAKQQLGAADPTKVAFFSGTKAVSRTSQLLTTAAPIGAAGLFVAVLLIAILEMLERNRIAQAEAAELERAEASRREAAGEHADETEDQPAHASIPDGRAPIDERGEEAEKKGESADLTAVHR